MTLHILFCNICVITTVYDAEIQPSTKYVLKKLAIIILIFKPNYV